MRMGRQAEARRSLAWALRVGPREIELPAAAPEGEKTLWHALKILIGPYLAEVWPARLRASGMGLGYGVGNLGKTLGPLGLALIVGSSNSCEAAGDGRGDRPSLPLSRLLVGARRRCLLVNRAGDEGRSIEEIDRALSQREAVTLQPA